MGDPEVMTHLTTGAIIVYTLEALKNWGWLRWVTADTKRVNRVLSFGLAILVALGITWEGSFATGWVFHVPSGPMLMSLLWEGLKQGFTQQVLYDGVVDRKIVLVTPPAHPLVQLSDPNG